MTFYSQSCRALLVKHKLSETLLNVQKLINLKGKTKYVTQKYRTCNYV